MVAKQNNISIPMVSMHSTSKGFYGECGLRGGFIQVENFDKAFMENLEKIVSINLCSNIPGQVAMSLVCNPPQEKEANILFLKEKSELLGSLQNKSIQM